MRKVISIRVLLFFSFLYLFAATAFSQQYILLGWNDLGMHCSNKDFSKMAVLPPYNNIHAQLIMKLPNSLPQVVTTGYTVEYSIPGNTYSVGKTNFWDYAQQLFNLPSPLTANIGLTGHGLNGMMDTTGNFFIETAIPVTPYQDTNLTTENPYQTIHLVAKAIGSSTILAYTDVVIPVSNEIGCVQSGCHASEQAILNSHESVSGFSKTGPNLCAKCHASNALGTTGIPEAGIFSYRIHNTHKDLLPLNDINTCYKCHPGPKTLCFRDVMRTGIANPLICQNCHGNLTDVASTIQAGRRPWLDEPQCGNINCHGSNYAEEPNTLFRMSKGHGGLACSACHGSPHAILPTIQPNDNIQNIRLQGTAGTLRNCLVCHSTPPTGPGPHGISYLPVELNFFTASVTGNVVKLIWKTATELNNMGFKVERSVNKADWKDITFIQGNGTSNSPKSYSYSDNTISTAGKYYYRLKQLDNDGSYKNSDIVEADLTAPIEFTLNQNYPNPFNPSTRISYTLPLDAKVTLEVYNLTGEKVGELVNQEQSAGYYTVDFNTSGYIKNITSGVYFYRLTAVNKFNGTNFTSSKKMMVLK